MAEAGRETGRIKSWQPGFKRQAGKRACLISLQYERRRDDELVKMAMGQLLVQHGSMVRFLAAGHVFVVGQQIMEIGFGGNADREDQQQRQRNKFLYGRGSFQQVFCQVKDSPSRPTRKPFRAGGPLPLRAAVK